MDDATNFLLVKVLKVDGLEVHLAARIHPVQAVVEPHRAAAFSGSCSPIDGHVPSQITAIAGTVSSLVNKGNSVNVSEKEKTKMPG